MTLFAVMCKPGYVAKNGLEPNCFPCPRGYFQPSYGKSYCYACPNHALTLERGSRSLTSCIGAIATSMRHFEITPTSQLTVNPCFAAPCNNSGSCNQLQTGYTCDCAPGWTGARKFLRKATSFLHSFCSAFQIPKCYYFQTKCTGTYKRHVGNKF